MTWKSFHRRGDILRTVITTANARRDGLLPMDVEGVAETFGDELTLLAALQLKWHTRLAGHVELELMSQPMDLGRAVQDAWGLAADELPGVRDVLDHYREHPLDTAMATAMTRATAKEHGLLALMSGRASVNDATATAIGARIEEQARAAHRGVTTLVAAPARPTFLERLRAVMAA